MIDALSARARCDIVVALIALLALPLFFYGLGDTYLWQDEAQTALLGRSVLAHGVPIVGVGSESISAVGGRDAGIRGIYFQVSWLQAYLAAASLKIFGESSWAARLPFAMCGWLCIPLGAWVIRTSGATRMASRIYAVLIALSVPFIICSRQARYYALAAALTLLATGTYAALSTSVRRGVGRITLASLSFAVAASLLSISFDITAIAVLGVLALHWMFVNSSAQTRFARPFWIAWGFACLVLATWFAISFTAPSRHDGAGLASLPNRLRYGAPYYVGQINAHIVPVPALLTLLTLWRKTIRGARREEIDGLRHAAVLLAFIALAGSLGAILPPYRFFRYIAPVFPIFIGLLAIGLASVWSLSRAGKMLAAATVATLVTSNAPFVWSHAALSTLARRSGAVTVRDRPIEYRIPLLLLVQEFRDPPRGPIAGAVEYLRAHARANDIVVTAYGELPLKFHTRLNVYGGETAQLPPAQTKAQWLWPRHLKVYSEVRASVEWIERQIAAGTYQRVELNVVDRRWENREDPEEHIFSNPGPGGPRIVLYRAAE